MIQQHMVSSMEWNFAGSVRLVPALSLKPISLNNEKNEIVVENSYQIS